MAKKRRRFTAAFKKRVALEALRERETIQAIAARHGVHPSQVTAWKRQALEGLEDVFARPGSKRVNAEVIFPSCAEVNFLTFSNLVFSF